MLSAVHSKSMHYTISTTVNPLTAEWIKGPFPVKMQYLSPFQKVIRLGVIVKDTSEDV
jgi:hypothetical protein